MIKLINDDCFTCLAEVPDHSVDLVLTDPPYNLAEYNTGNICLAGRKQLNSAASWDKGFSPERLLPHIKRILAPHGNVFIFCSYNLLGEYHRVFDPEFDTFQFMVWHKTNPAPSVRKTSFLKSCELIVCCWNKGHTWNFTRQNEMHNFIESPVCMGKERLNHPTQKPVKILEHIIRIASNEGDTVCDMFSGVGSTGVAAAHLHRSFIGIEADADYFRISQHRLDLQGNQSEYGN